MKRWLLHIWMMGVLGMLAASCSQVIDDPVSNGGCKLEKVMIRFTIALDKPKAASRSWDGYDPEYNPGNKGEVGTEEENSINNVHALLYDLNGVLMGQLDVIDVSPKENENENKHIHTVLGSIEMDADKISNMNFKLMVLANCSLPTDLNSLQYLTFTDLNNGSNIPMWGIATYEGVNLSGYTTQGKPYDLTQENAKPVYMLRSMAKIEVTLDDDTKAAGYTLEGATLNKVMESGYVLPALKDANGAAMTLANLTATTELGIDEVFHPFSGTAAVGNFTPSNNTTCVIYVPEYHNNTSEDLIIHLTGLMKDGKPFYQDVTNETPYFFKHGEYDNTGTYTSKLNVVRNHYYKYKVSIKDGRRLTLKLQANPWNKIEEVWSYEETLTVTTSGKMAWQNVRSQSDNVIVVNNEGTGQVTSCTFTITSPQDATWRAFLSPEHGDPKAFEFITETGESIGIATTGNVKDGMAELRIKPTGAVYGSNYNTARLLIYIDYMGRTQLAANLMPDNSKQYYIVRQNPQ